MRLSKNSKTQPPSKVRLAGVEFTIEYKSKVVSDSGEDLSGQCSGAERLIEVSTSENKTKDARDRTLLHECLHGILHVTGLSSMINDEDKEEAIVVALENALWLLMKFRPGAIK